MSKEKMITWMRNVNACAEACEWVGDRTPAQAWRDCQRSDWMLWALGRTSVDKRESVRVACDIALSVLHLNEDPRVAAAIDAAEGWCSGEVSTEECRTAAAAACTAAACAVACAAAAAARAACAVAVAAYAADAAVYAADAAVYVADAAADAEEYRAEIANLIRTRITPVQFAKLVRI